MPITSSSISSSEGPIRPWLGFVLAFALSAAIVLAGLFLFTMAADPYGTGRFALLHAAGVPAQGPRTAAASRARDPRFDAVVLGNSHVQLLSPARLDAGMGLAFLSLAIPGTGPKEQLLLLDYILRHHRARPLRALVWGIDSFWCKSDPALPNWLPFPFWLYARSPVAYLSGLLNYRSLADAGERVVVATGLGRRPLARPDGYWDYDEGRVWREDVEGAAVARPLDPEPPNDTGRFPAMAALAQALDRAPPGLPVAVVVPPVQAGARPPPGTPAARAEAACRAALGAALASRPRVALVAWDPERPELADPHNFIDPTHYRQDVARALERDIATALSALPPP